LGEVHFICLDDIHELDFSLFLGYISSFIRMTCNASQFVATVYLRKRGMRGNLENVIGVPDLNLMSIEVNRLTVMKD